MIPTKLYTVMITLQTVIAVEDGEDPIQVAQRDGVDIYMDAESHAKFEVVNQIKSLADLPPGWTGDAIPYGLDVMHDIVYVRDLVPAKPPTIRTREVITRNRCQCVQCGDIIESVHRHHFVRCKCGSIFTDGGKDYIRRGAGDMDDIIDLTESHSEQYESDW